MQKPKQAIKAMGFRIKELLFATVHVSFLSPIIVAVRIQIKGKTNMRCVPCP